MRTDGLLGLLPWSLLTGRWWWKSLIKFLLAKKLLTLLLIVNFGDKTAALNKSTVPNILNERIYDSCYFSSIEKISHIRMTKVFAIAAFFGNSQNSRQYIGFNAVCFIKLIIFLSLDYIEIQIKWSKHPIAVDKVNHWLAMINRNFQEKLQGYIFWIKMNMNTRFSSFRNKQHREQ